MRNFKKHIAVLMALVLVISMSAVSPMTAFAQQGRVYTLEHDGFTLEFNVVSVWTTGYNAEVVITNNTDEGLYQWVLNLNRNMGLLENGVQGGVLAYQEGSVTTVGYIDWNSYIPAGESITLWFTNTRTDGSLPIPTDFRITPATRVLIPVEDYTYSINYHNEWSNRFDLGLSTVNVSDRVIQGWELEFEINGVIESTSIGTLVTTGPALIIHTPRSGQSWHPGQNNYFTLGGVGSGVTITDLQIFEMVAVPYEDFDDTLVPRPTPSPSPSPSPSPTPTPGTGDSGGGSTVIVIVVPPPIIVVNRSVTNVIINHQVNNIVTNNVENPKVRLDVRRGTGITITGQMLVRVTEVRAGLSITNEVRITNQSVVRNTLVVNISHRVINNLVITENSDVTISVRNSYRSTFDQLFSNKRRSSNRFTNITVVNRMLITNLFEINIRIDDVPVVFPGGPGSDESLEDNDSYITLNISDLGLSQAQLRRLGVLFFYLQDLEDFESLTYRMARVYVNDEYIRIPLFGDGWFGLIELPEDFDETEDDEVTEDDEAVEDYDVIEDDETTEDYEVIEDDEAVEDYEVIEDDEAVEDYEVIEDDEATEDDNEQGEDNDEQ